MSNSWLSEWLFTSELIYTMGVLNTFFFFAKVATKILLETMLFLKNPSPSFLLYSEAQETPGPLSCTSRGPTRELTQTSYREPPPPSRLLLDPEPAPSPHGLAKCGSKAKALRKSGRCLKLKVKRVTRSKGTILQLEDKQVPGVQHTA